MSRALFHTGNVSSTPDKHSSVIESGGEWEELQLGLQHSLRAEGRSRVVPGPAPAHLAESRLETIEVGRGGEHGGVEAAPRLILTEIESGPTGASLSGVLGHRRLHGDNVVAEDALVGAFESDAPADHVVIKHEAQRAWQRGLGGGIGDISACQSNEC